MQKVFRKDLTTDNIELIFASENETEVKYVFLTLKDYHAYEPTISIFVEEDTEPKYETLDDFLDVPEYQLHFEEILKKSQK